MSRLARIACLLAVAALLAGCGGHESAPAKGPPAARFGPEPARALGEVERIRARLEPVAALVTIGRRGDALAQLRAAERRWRELSGDVRGRDPVLEREVSVAFRRAERAIERGGTFDTVRDRVNPLGAQLLGGVIEALVGRRARFDPGVNAVVLIGLTRALDDAYAEAVSPAGEIADRLAMEHSLGLLKRAQAGARDIAEHLGDQRDPVVNGLKDLRGRAFPEGTLLPPSPVRTAEVARALAEVRAAVAERFELTGA